MRGSQASRVVDVHPIPPPARYSCALGLPFLETPNAKHFMSHPEKPWGTFPVRCHVGTSRIIDPSPCIGPP